MSTSHNLFVVLPLPDQLLALAVWSWVKTMAQTPSEPPAFFSATRDQLEFDEYDDVIGVDAHPEKDRLACIRQRTKNGKVPPP